MVWGMDLLYIDKNEIESQSRISDLAPISSAEDKISGEYSVAETGVADLYEMHITDFRVPEKLL
jgi:hypothetical protein